VKDGSFSYSDLPREHCETLAAHDHFDQRGQRSRMGFGEVEELWVRRQPERLFPQLVERRVHQELLTVNRENITPITIAAKAVPVIMAATLDKFRMRCRSERITEIPVSGGWPKT
jgi:hypothetical protein